MRTSTALLAASATLLLAGCGPDVLTSAASSASSAAVAAKQAQQEKQIADQKIQAMQNAMQQHDQRMSEQADHAGDPAPQERGSQ